MRHWKTEINFEAWDREDATRMRDKMIAPIDAESRLIFSTGVVETTEFHTGDASADPRQEEFSAAAVCPACNNQMWRTPHNCTDGPPSPGCRWDGEQWLFSSEWLSPPEE